MTAQTIARLYESYDQALEVVHDLVAAQVPQNDISFVAGGAHNGHLPAESETGNESGPGAEIGAGVGALAGGGVGVLAGLGMLAIPGVGPVVAAGWLVALALGAAGGAVAGGLLGGLVGAGISREHAEVLTEGVRRGGTLVTVLAPEDRVALVEAIMDHRAVDPAALRTRYASEGWTGYDFNGPDLTPTEQERERALLRR